MEKFLGVSSVLTKAGNASLSSVLGTKKYVMLYFSASWCGPCKQFTPKLVEFYNKHKDSKDLEIIFISRDRDEASFNDYYTHHPWPAVYGPDITGALAAKLKVKGIPALFVVDTANPETPITSEGRFGVMADADASCFPWPPGLSSTLFSQSCINKNGESVLLSDLEANNDYVFLYFSASWCGPCKQFTPKLAEFYNKHKDSKKFETVFMSLDRDEDSFKAYYATQPWLALYGPTVQVAASILRVQGIPSLFLYDTKKKTVVVDSAVEMVRSDPDAAEFPWRVSLSSVLKTPTLMGQKDSTVEKADVIANNDYVMLYFSASWCGPCKQFTPKLVEFYNKHKDSKKFEVVFMSLDRDEASFKAYYATQPWLALYDDAITKAAAGRVGLEGVPTLIIFDKEGNIVTQEGVEEIMGDFEGAGFPWRK